MIAEQLLTFNAFESFDSASSSFSTAPRAERIFWTDAESQMLK